MTVGTIVAVIVIAGLLMAFIWLGNNLERFFNRVEPHELPKISEGVQALHDSQFIVDLHCDATLFGRNLLKRSAIGHVDIPRLQDGNVGLQVFAVATVTPLGLNIDSTDHNRLDMLTVSGAVQRMPTAWKTPFGRAMWQAGRMHEFAQNSQGQLRVIQNVKQLDQLIADRMGNRKLVGSILGIEGAQALDDDLANFTALFNIGYRIIGLTHFHDTAFAGSAHGLDKGGLTPMGRQLIQLMIASNVIADLSHLSPAAIDDILAMSKRPLIASHGGAKGILDNRRNLSDHHLRAIADRGGVAGVGYWVDAVGSNHPRDIVRTIKYAINVMGEDHVSLGSDFDGSITAAFDTSQINTLTAEMATAGLSHTVIGKVLGGNALRLLRLALPQE